MIDTPDPRTVHGQLIEAIHLSGYSFQRAWAEFKYLLEDQRWKKCGFKTIKEFVRSVDFSEFRISQEERLEVAALLCLSHGASQRSVAGMLGVDEGTIRNVLESENAEKSAKHSLDTGENAEKSADGNAAPAKSKGADKRTAHERIAKKYFNTPALHVPEGFPLRLGDFYELSSELKDDSVDLIFTDPPYDDESLPLFGKMGEVAARVLKEGGSLVTYLGHLQLPKALELLSRHLKFWHPLCCLHAGPYARMTEYGIIETWKPMLWFVKGTRGDKHAFVESAISGAREKDTHEWQQAESEAAYFINLLSPPDGLVVDFCAGGGTTIVAAEQLGRNVIGYEIAEKHFRKAMARISAAPVFGGSP